MSLFYTMIIICFVRNFCLIYSLNKRRFFLKIFIFLLGSIYNIQAGFQIFRVNPAQIIQYTIELISYAIIPIFTKK
jgi:hypothetical protein